MLSNSKFLAIFSFLIFILGFFFLWFGFRSEQVILPSPTPRIDLESTNSATFNFEGQQALVTSVIDGDTIEINEKDKVRLLGIDTPETKDPRKSVQCFGKEASSEMRKLVFQKVVYLQKDVSETDKYGRLLRYVYLPLENGMILFVNDYLIREGFATVLTYPPDVKFTTQFLEAQSQAKETKKGLWGKC